MAAMITVFLVIHLLFLMVSSNPELSDTVTEDAHCLCDMSAFDSRLHSLIALQIVKKAEPGQGDDVVLATVDSTEARLSDTLLDRDHQKHYVSGRNDPSRIRDSFLQLTIVDFAEDEEGVYSCQIHYTDHPADTEHRTWSRELTVKKSGSDVGHTSGFRVRFSRGVHITCDYSDTSDSQDHVTEMTIAATDRLWNASWCEEENTTKCSPDLLGPYHRRKRSGAQNTLEVHIPSATCQHQSDHVCTVTTSSGKTLRSSKIHLQLENCPKAETPVADKTTTASSTVASSTTVDGEASNVVCYVAPVTGVVLVLASVGLFCFLRRRRRRQPGDKSLNKHTFWHKMNGGFKQNSKQRSSEEMENDQNCFKASIGSDKRGDSPLLSEEMENDQNYMKASMGLDKGSDSPLLSDAKKKEIDAEERCRMKEALLSKLSEEDSSAKACVASPKLVINIDSSSDPTTEKDKVQHSVDKFDSEIAGKALCNRSDSNSSEDSCSSPDSSSYIDLSRKMKTPVQASESPDSIIHVV